MTNFEIGKCIELGRKWPNLKPEDVIKRVWLYYNKDMPKKEKRSLELIAKITCDYMNEDVKELLTPKGNNSGRDELSRIRQIISLIAHIDHNYSYSKIGIFLIRKRSTIFIICKKAQNFYNQENQFKTDVDTCRNFIEKAIIAESIKEETEQKNN